MSPDFRGRHARWRKTHGGVTYSVTCAELGLPEGEWTPLLSYRAANLWWEAKRKAVDAPLESERDRIVARLKAIQGEERALLGEIDDRLAEFAPAVFKPTVRPQDRVTVGQALDRWYALMRVNSEASSLVGLSLFVRDCKALRASEDGPAVVSADMPATAIDEGLVEQVYHHVDAVKRKPATKVRYFGLFKAFVGYCAETKLIPAPANLYSKRLTWAVPTVSKGLPDWTQVVTFLDGLPDRLRLYALLALNTGMNNIDIGKLTERQLNFDTGTLRRKRVKTEGWANVPTVLYRVWGETARLLRQEMTPGADYALLDARYEPLYVTSKLGGAKVYDKVKTQWRDTLGRSSKRPYTPKDFRDFGSLLLQNSPYRSYRVSWLGHTPKEVHETNYSGEEDVTEACEWMESVIFPGTRREPEPARAGRASDRSGRR